MRSFPDDLYADSEVGAKGRADEVLCVTCYRETGRINGDGVVMRRDG